MAAGDSPPWAGGAGAIVLRIPITSRRGRVQGGVCRVTPICERLHWRRHQGRAALAAAGDDQARGDIGLVLASKELEIPFEYRPQADTGFKTAIIEQEGSARDAVCSDHALVAVHRQQYAGRLRPRCGDRNDPILTEVLAKEPFFYGARRIHRKGTGQGVRAFRALRIDGGYVQHRQQPSVDAEDRRAGAAQIHMPRAEMLASMDRYRPLLSDAGADAVGALDLLGPDAAEPGSPVLELARLHTFAAMLDRDTSAVAEQNRVSGLTNHFV